MGSPSNPSCCLWANLIASDSLGAELLSIGDYLAIRVDNLDNPPTPRISGFYKRTTSGWANLSYNATYAGTGWHHFCFVMNDGANTQQLYVDASLVASGTSTQSILYTGQGSSTFVGRHGNGGTTYHFGGDIGEAAVWNTSLTQADITQLYSSKVKRMPLQVKTSNLIMYLPLDQATAGTSVDTTVFSDMSGTNTMTADNGANNTGMTAAAETILSYQPSIIGQ